MTTREFFRRMRRDFEIAGGDLETLREFVDQVTAASYGECPTRPTIKSRGGRRVTTARDLAMDVCYLLATGGVASIGISTFFDRLTIEQLEELFPFVVRRSYSPRELEAPRPFNAINFPAS
jgi:hypothetical protein